MIFMADGTLLFSAGSWNWTPTSITTFGTYTLSNGTYTSKFIKKYSGGDTFNGTYNLINDGPAITFFIDSGDYTFKLVNKF